GPAAAVRRRARAELRCRPDRSVRPRPATGSASVADMAIRTANARWEGTFSDGTGIMRTGKGGLEANFSAKSRFEEGEGSNPEELIGAALAGCFSMALAKALGEAGFRPTSVE